MERIDVFREQAQYQHFHNCLSDAFENARLTLEARERKFGASSPAVLGWLKAQDEVFRNCATGPAAIPEAAAAKTREERKFAAVYLLLRAPGLKPYVPLGFGERANPTKLDNLRNNWWCAFGGGRAD